METIQNKEILQSFGVLISKLPSVETAERREESHHGDRRDLSLEKGSRQRGSSHTSCQDRKKVR